MRLAFCLAVVLLACQGAVATSQQASPCENCVKFLADLPKQQAALNCSKSVQDRARDVCSGLPESKTEMCEVLLQTYLSELDAQLHNPVRVCFDNYLLFMHINCYWSKILTGEASRSGYPWLVCLTASSRTSHSSQSASAKSTIISLALNIEGLQTRQLACADLWGAGCLWQDRLGSSGSLNKRCWAELPVMRVCDVHDQGAAWWPWDRGRLVSASSTGSFPLHSSAIDLLGALTSLMQNYAAKCEARCQIKHQSQSNGHIYNEGGSKV